MAGTHREHLLPPTQSTTHPRPQPEEAEREKPHHLEKPPETRQKHERQATEYAREEQNPASQDERDDPEQIR
jgi:hypothetical protein